MNESLDSPMSPEWVDLITPEEIRAISGATIAAAFRDLEVAYNRLVLMHRPRRRRSRVDLMCDMKHALAETMDDLEFFCPTGGANEFLAALDISHGAARDIREKFTADALPVIEAMQAAIDSFEKDPGSFRFSKKGAE